MLYINRLASLSMQSGLSNQQRRWLGRKMPSPAKPPILPPAKSKLYRVAQPKWLKPEDVADLLWRRHAYNNAVLSMRRLFREEYEQQKKTCIGLDKARREVNEELDRLLAENDQRNKDLAAARAEREKETYAKLEEETLRDIERRLEKESLSVEKKAKEVQEMIDRSKDFLTKENMDDKIRQALENPVNFDYAIDLTGAQIPNPPPQPIYTSQFAALKMQQKKRIQETTSGFTLRKMGPIARPKKGKQKGKQSTDESAPASADSGPETKN